MKSSFSVKAETTIDVANARTAMPETITTIATIRPSGVTGTTSPYPTVEIVTMDQ